MICMSNTTDSTVLVTGGSGYIARYCIAHLLTAGWKVRATLRDASKVAQIRSELAAFGSEGSSLEFATADLEKDDGWNKAVAGCDYVLHVASPIPAISPKNDEELVRPALEGTKRVLRAAADHDVRRVVMTSAGAAVAYGQGGRSTPFTEDDWSIPDPSDTSAYDRSKIAAEGSVWAWTAENPKAAELVTICPGAVIGPAMGDQFSASIQIIKKLIDGSLPGLPRMSFPLVDVRDVADLHVRAMAADVARGQRYIGAGPTLWMADIAQIIRNEVPSVAGRVPRRKLPDWLVRLSALFDPVTRARLYELGKYRQLSSAKAMRDLGWEPRPTNVSIKETVVSLEELARARRVQVQ